MDGWDMALLAAAGFVAATALARVMLYRRNQLVRELLEQAQRERQQGQDGSGKRDSQPPAEPRRAA